MECNQNEQHMDAQNSFVQISICLRMLILIINSLIIQLHCDYDTCITSCQEIPYDENTISVCKHYCLYKDGECESDLKTFCNVDGYFLNTSQQRACKVICSTSSGISMVTYLIIAVAVIGALGLILLICICLCKCRCCTCPRNDKELDLTSTKERLLDYQLTQYAQLQQSTELPSRQQNLQLTTESSPIEQRTNLPPPIPPYPPEESRTGIY